MVRVSMFTNPSEGASQISVRANPNPDPNPNPNQVLPRGRRSVGFVEFRGALLPLVARKKDVPLAELVRSLLGDGHSDPGLTRPLPVLRTLP